MNAVVVVSRCVVDWEREGARKPGVLLTFLVEIIRRPSYSYCGALR